MKKIIAIGLMGTAALAFGGLSAQGAEIRILRPGCEINAENVDPEELRTFLNDGGYAIITDAVYWRAWEFFKLVDKDLGGVAEGEGEVEAEGDDGDVGAEAESGVEGDAFGDFAGVELEHVADAPVAALPYVADVGEEGAFEDADEGVAVGCGVWHSAEPVWYGRAFLTDADGLRGGLASGYGCGGLDGACHCSGGCALRVCVTGLFALQHAYSYAVVDMAAARTDLAVTKQQVSV